MEIDDAPAINTSQYIAAKFAVYDEILRMLVLAAPNAAEIKNEVNLTIEHWKITFDEDSDYMIKIAEQTRDELFTADDEPS